MKTYYYIAEINAVASRSGNTYCLYDKERGWTKVHHCIVEDYLNGYDPSEPAGSPYRFGNLDIMDEITQITGTEARKRYSAPDYQYHVKEEDQE